VTKDYLSKPVQEALLLESLLSELPPCLEKLVTALPDANLLSAGREAQTLKGWPPAAAPSACAMSRNYAPLSKKSCRRGGSF
jgi:hypothetical protein